MWNGKLNKYNMCFFFSDWRREIQNISKCEMENWINLICVFFLATEGEKSKIYQNTTLHTWFLKPLSLNPEEYLISNDNRIIFLWKSLGFKLVKFDKSQCFYDGFRVDFFVTYIATSHRARERERERGREREVEEG